MEDFIVIHRPAGRAFSTKETGFVLWKTCVRQMVLGFGAGDASQALQVGDEIYSGTDAYRFCLEVICGLHSPVLGETEVLGQFREHFENFVFPKTPWGKELQKIVNQLLQDSKIVRRNLKNLGSQTYGSAVRRYLKGTKGVALIGSGQLSESILPWVASEHLTYLYARNLKKAQDLARGLDKEVKVRMWSPSQPFSPNLEPIEAVVIAAPIQANEFSTWAMAHKLQIVVDLREESSGDPISTLAKVVGLKDFFSKMSLDHMTLKERVDEAFSLARQLAQKKAEACVVRPYGWEDLCV